MADIPILIKSVFVDTGSKKAVEEVGKVAQKAHEESMQMAQKQIDNNKKLAKSSEKL